MMTKRKTSREYQNKVVSDDDDDDQELNKPILSKNWNKEEN